MPAIQEIAERVAGLVEVMEDLREESLPAVLVLDLLRHLVEESSAIVRALPGELPIDTASQIAEHAGVVLYHCQRAIEQAEYATSHWTDRDSELWENGLDDIAKRVSEHHIELVRIYFRLSVMTPDKTDAKTDTRKFVPKKKRRPLSAAAAMCAREYSLARKSDDSLRLKHFVADWAAEHGKSPDSIYRTLTDHPEYWKTDNERTS